LRGRLGIILPKHMRTTGNDIALAPERHSASELSCQFLATLRGVDWVILAPYSGGKRGE
jgi:hypothetical protein